MVENVFFFLGGGWSSDLFFLQAALHSHPKPDPMIVRCQKGLFQPAPIITGLSSAVLFGLWPHENCLGQDTH